MKQPMNFNHRQRGLVLFTRWDAICVRLFGMHRTPEEQADDEFVDRQLAKHDAYMAAHRNPPARGIRMRDKREALKASGALIGGAA